MREELSSSTSFKKAENHLDYLIQTKKLPSVKNDGSTVKATNNNKTISQKGRPTAPLIQFFKR